jgi:hypothetical protein
MRKYKEPLTVEELARLDGLSQKDFCNFTEADVREEYIAPVLELLGYQKNTDYEVEREESSDLKWLNIDNSGLQRFDYKFNIRKKYFWLIEAKNGKSKDITKESVEQAYLYSFNPDINCRFFVVCNGWHFNLYDRNKFLNNNNDDIFTPVLTIGHFEIKTKFDLLYSYLGSSEIIFKVKEDIILQDIKNTLSAEINPDRLKQFSAKVDDVINSSATQVLENIRKIHDWKREIEIEEEELGKLLNSMRVETVVDLVFDGFLTGLRLAAGCTVIKNKLFELKSLFMSDRGYSTLDYFFDHLFLIPMRPVKIDYFWNIIGLIRALELDDRFSEMMCKYHKQKVSIKKLLDCYFLDMFNFFENRPDIRAYIIVYPLFLRTVKSLIYGIANSIIDHSTSKLMDFQNYYFTEEQLERMHFSKGHAIIMLTDEIMRKTMYDFCSKSLTKPYNNYPALSKPTVSSIGMVINTEIIKRTINELDITIRQINEKINLDKLREQSRQDEQDEMFAFDRHYTDPWTSIYISSINILLNGFQGRAFAASIVDRAKYLVENRFLGAYHCLLIMDPNESRDFLQNKDQDDMLKKIGVTRNSNEIHDRIVSEIKYKTWEKPELKKWNIWGK